MAAPADDRRKWWVLLAVGTGSFMAALDGSVANIILPLLARAFSADVARVEWVVTLYLLLVSGLLLSVGRLGDLRGPKPVYVAGFAVFGLASLLCGQAPSVEALIGARALQAVGGAMLFALSPGILTRQFPAEQRGQALGLQATMTYLGLTVGPSLGGWLATELSWRAVFYVNVPISLVALAISLRFIPADPPRRDAEPFDVPGALTFLFGLSSLLLALNQGHAWGWTSPPTLALFAIALALLGLFLVHERRSPAPMLDLGLFARRAFAAATASAMLNYVCVSSVLFLLPFALIQGRGLSAAQVGLLLSVQSLVMAASAPLSGTLSDRIGTRIPAALGMTVLAAGVWLLSGLGPDASFVQIALALAVVGLGTGSFISPNNSALMGAAPANRQGIAGGVLATARNAGMALGVGLAGAVFTTAVVQGPDDVETIFAAVRVGLRLAAVAALLGGGIALLREGRAGRA